MSSSFYPILNSGTLHCCFPADAASTAALATATNINQFKILICRQAENQYTEGRKEDWRKKDRKLIS